MPLPPQKVQRRSLLCKDVAGARQAPAEVLKSRSSGADGCWPAVAAPAPGEWRTAPATSQEVLALRGMRGDLQQQLRSIIALGFPAPRVVSAKTLDRLGSLQRARKEWQGRVAPQEEEPGQTLEASSGGLGDWNRRDPLCPAVVDKATVPLTEVGSSTGSDPLIAFAALPRGDLPEVMEECSPRLTAALGAFAATSGEMMVLVPSLVASAAPSQASLRASAAAAMPLYLQCCQVVLHFGELPAVDKEAISSLHFEVVDLQPQLREKERAAAAGCSGLGVDQDAVERCNQLWEAAEKASASQPPKKLPRFRPVTIGGC